MSENRRSDRVPTSMKARLLSDNLNVVCTVLDVSPTGARIQIPPGLFLPRQLLLRAAELGPDRTVQIVWRNKTQVGVSF